MLKKCGQNRHLKSQGPTLQLRWKYKTLLSPKWGLFKDKVKDFEDLKKQKKKFQVKSEYITFKRLQIS